MLSRSSAGGSRNLLLPTPQHTPSLAGLAEAQQLSRPSTPTSPVTAQPSASAGSPTHHWTQGSSRVGLRPPVLSTHPETFHSQLGWQPGGVGVEVENGDKGITVGGKGAAESVTG